MQMKLRMTPDQVFEQAMKAIGWAREYTDNVEFRRKTPGARSPISRAGSRSGDRRGCDDGQHPDTVGYTMPWQFGALIASLRERIPNSSRRMVRHCHNDLGWRLRTRSRR
jgi:2-isopropylmalate synthase